MEQEQIKINRKLQTIDYVEFIKYRYSNLDMRFWQALLAWVNEKQSNITKIILEDKDGNQHDTFYFE